MKASWKDLRLKLVDAVDRGMARQEVAHNREALEEAIPDALLLVKLKYVAGWFFTLRLRTTGSILIKTAVRSGLRRNGRCVIHGVLTRFDPNPHAVPCNHVQSREQ